MKKTASREMLEALKNGRLPDDDECEPPVGTIGEWIGFKWVRAAA